MKPIQFCLLLFPYKTITIAQSQQQDINRLVEVTDRQAKTVDKQAQTVDRLALMLERVLSDRIQNNN